ncbi:bacteriophytochrome (light-regulated signal transduction histidine kinase) [Rivularia sp. PCC 7116]|uniref:sensor histidine kinase n=1 Tax=Rivularia sp. PCC 7116 TaxID=373994 RepID=UPI00029F3497|nr:ATP-binding protein [Rivularia sp. PCC 7116]AFY57098.1 bacteriophytochrome (light-regulated signal transduction histidine kinase) [Rivularia sp. PCC 7116]
MIIDSKPNSLNLTNLKEPVINLNSKIQNHGVLIVLQEPELNILQVSRNAASMLDCPIETLLETNLEDLLDPYQIVRIKSRLAEDSLDFTNPTKIWIKKRREDYAVFDAVFHRNPEGILILELEPAISEDNIPFLSFYHLAKASINKLQESANLQDYCQIIVETVRKVTGFDRVMLYKFNENNHGCVLAEDKLESMEPYLGLNFPESDIPKPARKMFLSNLIRLIPDASGESVDLFPQLNPITERPVDLMNSSLRSPYPCHIEYLHNMGVGASLTISLIKDGRLWGLIACHHQTPKFVSYELRKACEFLGRMIFNEIYSREETQDYDYRMKLTYIQSTLIDYMSQEDNFIAGLVKHQPNLLDLTSAQGAAICFGGNYTLIGETPKEEDINNLVTWLQTNGDEEVFYTNSLPEIYPDAEKIKNLASGLLAIPIGKRNYVLWFRPEVIQTVNWGGNPNKAFEVNEESGNLRLCPRKSFELWKQTVRLTSLPWQYVEVKAALELRKAIVNIVLRQAEELAILAADLERSNAELKKFAYVASHDLQEPLNQVANYVQLLEMRYQDALDEDADEFIGYVVGGVSLMQTLIDDVLAYSKVDMQSIEFATTSAEQALEKALNNLRRRIEQTGAKITHDELPTVMADSTQLMQLFQNLIGNAIKFKSEKPPEIHISVSRSEDEWLFSVSDNGIGIEPRFRDRIFVIFQRLHTRDEYPGTGMGLAICKKIAECHRGNIWVESQLGEGATFNFTIPLKGRERERRNGTKTQNHLFGRG